MEYKVSIWVGREIIKDEEDDRNILEEIYGINDYDEDMEEANFYIGELSSVEELIEPLSFSDSFIDEVLDKMEEMGIEEGGYVIAVYDYVFDNTKGSDKDPVFIGTFDYSEDF